MTQILTLHLGDTFEVLPTLDGIGAIISDPPYGLSFMGKSWDTLDGRHLTGEGSETVIGGSPKAMQQWHAAWVLECLRLLPPGGIAKIFSATRTFHRLAAAMDEVGFVDIHLEAWMYGSGFPKSLNIAKAIDKHLGVEREVLGTREAPLATGEVFGEYSGVVKTTKAATPEAAKFEGWGTALKPAWEPFIVGRKPE